MFARLAWTGLLLVALGIVVPRAEAVVVELHDKGQLVHGKLVQLTPQLVVVDQVAGDGTTQRLQFSRDEIAKLSLNVSDDRLAALDPHTPLAYFQYAEELSDFRNDPDARETAIRLYLIAGQLDADRLGDQALNGLISLARTAAEERLLRAMRHLRQVASRTGTAPLSAQRDRALLDSGAVEGLMECIRSLRSGDRRKALEQLARPEVRDALTRIHCELTGDDIQRLAHGECSACIDGRVHCERCGGEGRAESASGRVPCANCRETGLVQCTACRGRDYFTRPSPESLRKLLALELDILSQRAAAGEPASGNRPIRADGYRNWSLAQHKQPRATLLLDWSNVTEFDPRESVYVGNRWTRP